MTGDPTRPSFFTFFPTSLPLLTTDSRASLSAEQSSLSLAQMRQEGCLYQPACAPCSHWNGKLPHRHGFPRLTKIWLHCIFGSESQLVSASKDSGFGAVDNNLGGLPCLVRPKSVEGVGPKHQNESTKADPSRPVLPLRPTAQGPAGIAPTTSQPAIFNPTAGLVVVI